MTSHASPAISDVLFNQMLVNITGLDGAITATPQAGFTERADVATPASGQQAAVSVNDKTTFNKYDIDRQRVLRKDPNGDVTLYLPGGTELKKPAASGVVGTRYYAVGGSNVAVRTPSSLDWVVGDALGSLSTTVDYASGTIRRQYLNPWGAVRATSTNGVAGGSFVTEHSFLNQTRDTSTGLSYLTNRYMDSSTGTFLSVDPLVGKTGQAYLYGNGNPVAFADPLGLEAHAPGANRQCEHADGAHCGGTSTQPKSPGASANGQKPKKSSGLGCPPHCSGGAGPAIQPVYGPPGPQSPVEDPSDPMSADWWRIASEIFDAQADIDPKGMAVGLCGSADAAAFVAAELSGCVVADGQGIAIVGFDALFTGGGYGTPAVGAAATIAQFNRDVATQRGPGLCLGASYGLTGTVCGGMAYSKADGLWHYNDHTAIYLGVTLGTDDVVPEGHVLFGNTGVTQVKYQDVARQVVCGGSPWCPL